MSLLVYSYHTVTLSFFFFCVQETAFDSALYLQRLCPRSLVDSRRSVPVSSGSTVTSIRLKTYKELLFADRIYGAVLEFSLDTWTSFSFAKRNSLFSRHNIVVRGGGVMHNKFSLGSELMKLTLNYSAERQAHGMCNCSFKHLFNIYTLLDLSRHLKSGSHPNERIVRATLADFEKNSCDDPAAIFNFLSIPNTSDRVDALPLPQESIM